MLKISLLAANVPYRATLHAEWADCVNAELVQYIKDRLNYFVYILQNLKQLS